MSPTCPFQCIPDPMVHWSRYKDSELVMVAKPDSGEKGRSGEMDWGGCKGKKDLVGEKVEGREDV